MARTASSLFALLVASGLALIAGEKDAFALDGEWHAGADAGLAFLGTQAGLGGGAHLVYGLSDAFNAMLKLDLSHHGASTDGSPNTNVMSAGLGVAYTLDVTRWVPYAGLLAGGYRLTGDAALWAPGFQIPLGLDYRFDRHFSAGIQVRYHTLFTFAPFDSRSYATTFLRAEWVWGG